MVRKYNKSLEQNSSYESVEEMSVYSIFSYWLSDTFSISDCNISTCSFSNDVSVFCPKASCTNGTNDNPEN